MSAGHGTGAQQRVAPARHSAQAGALLALVAGVVFAFGLVISGMTQPVKVQAFLDFSGMVDGPFPGRWDPSLAFVMGGAVAVSLLAYGLVARSGRAPWLAEGFSLPTARSVDRRLVLGAALFGVGWGLAGYCPGPALAVVLTGGWDALWFCGPMLVGMAGARLWIRRAAG
jgi:uncharacterized membrane protein YedE/YeeE